MNGGTSRSRQPPVDVTESEPSTATDPREWIVWEHGPIQRVARVLSVGTVGLFGLVTLRSAAGRPDWVLGWSITFAFLVFTGALVVGRHLALGEETRLWWHFPTQLGLFGVLLWAVYQSQTAGVGFGLGLSRISVTIVLLWALLGFCVLADHPARYSRTQWFVFAGLASLVTLYFYHGLAFSPVRPESHYPLWGGVLFGLWVMVIPRHLPAELFLWAIARLAAGITLLGLVAYIVGPYTVFGLDIGFHDAYTFPLLDLEIPGMRAYFVDRTTYAIVVFAGVIASLAEVHRVFRAERFTRSLAIPLFLLVINATGYVASYGRGIWLVGVIGLLIYGGYVLAGRRSIPVTTVLGAVYLVSGIVAVYFGYTRGLPGLVNWSDSLGAVRDNPSLLGHGLVNSREFTGLYASGSTGLHNSYFGTWIRMGQVGILAYGSIVLAGLANGLRRYRSIDVAVFALAVTFAAHQLFGSYTMYGWVIGSAIAATSLGYAAFGIDRECVAEPAGTAESTPEAG